jgi:hypothetical protein
MIKKLVLAVCVFMMALAGRAQEHMPNRVNTYSDAGGDGTGFLKQNLFLGGSLSLGFSGYDFNVGGSPEIGYSLNKWLDAGVLVNLNYSSERADPSGYYNSNIRYRSFNYGAGAFARVWPLPFLFVTVQPEYNWIDYNAKDMSSGFVSTASTQASSFLLGIGYGQRVVGRGNFYIALLFDALDNPYSPYRDFNGAALPVVRAGFDFYLHPNR